MERELETMCGEGKRKEVERVDGEHCTGEKPG